jgi:mono/diheme cytochrome c family protein
MVPAPGNRIRVAGLALLALGCIAPGASQAPEDHSGLTRETFRQKCLLCHSAAAPEGVSAKILEGLNASSKLTPREAMPGISCWRRCKDCWGRETHAVQ